MTQLLLEIPQNQDLDLLLALLKKFEVRVVRRSVVPGPSMPKSNDPQIALILAGLPERADFEEFVREFEESRKDRPLPNREN